MNERNKYSEAVFNIIVFGGVQMPAMRARLTAARQRLSAARKERKHRKRAKLTSRKGKLESRLILVRNELEITNNELQRVREKLTQARADHTAILDALAQGKRLPKRIIMRFKAARKATTIQSLQALERKLAQRISSLTVKEKALTKKAEKTAEKLQRLDAQLQAASQ
ncbi:MAG: hypothetical protein DRO07_00070 [Candidatus Iainarchaeum archaeon]|uniref:Uncharacterized protein n=1 Tax=Candidatus Iainarchaeum sp. TaxID=3101447 RepID=A0A497JHC1_9ARCH|nr:MAG: hypothetical protein DRO07_00070 [Candidatus Diapherotrites archaeon]